MNQLTIESAKELVNSHMVNQNLRRHCYAVGYALAAYYDYYKQMGKDVGALTKEQWQIVGTLHDADWEETAQQIEKHTLTTIDWLKDYPVAPEIIDALKSHNTKITKLRDPQTLLEWTMECCDELTGFIVAIALIMPSKSLKDVTVERILKRFKQKEFARQVDRSQITQCEQKVGIATAKFVEITLKAMQENSVELGLA
jgi:uncharacterized protein